MSTLSLHSSRSTGQYAGAWVISFAFHGLALALFIALVTSLHLPPEPNVFRWDVAFVESPESTSEASATSLQPVLASAAASPSRAIPALVSPPAQTVAVEPQPVIKPIERIETVRILERVQPVQSVHTVQTSESVTFQEVNAVTSLPHESSASTAQAIQENTPPVSRPVRETGSLVHSLAPSAMISTAESPAVVHSARAAQETVKMESVPVTHEKQVMTHDQPVRNESLSGLETVQVETRTPAIRPMMEAKATAAPSQLPGSAIDRVAKRTGVAGAPKNKPAFINLEASQGRSASFGWLTEAIKRSELQRRPVADHEGTTLFRITMRQDGSTVHLLDLSVLESSGYPQVDRAAADLVRRSFPIELAEPLAKSQVRVDQPITIHTN